MKNILIFIISVFCAISLPISAYASGGAEKKIDPQVRMAMVALPVVKDGRVVNYVFVKFKLILSPKADAVKLQAKEPFFRDILVRSAQKSDYWQKGRTDTLDPDLLRKNFLPLLSGHTNKGDIVTLLVLSQNPKLKGPGYFEMPSEEPPAPAPESKKAKH